MRRRLTTIIAILLVVQLLIAGVASAAYNAQDDMKVNVNVPVCLPTTNIAGFTFNTQESVHNNLYKTSNVSVDHYYIWIYVNGTPVAAIDPAKFCY
jgi:hypothetical protein